ncbi:hypothetical protein Lal_00018655 [Lupinus albus]|nr:hypothetical protein Lal_00018655 [Lupinus albus]
MIDERDAQKALLRHRPVMDSSFGTDRSFILARMLFILVRTIGLMHGNSTRIRRTLPDPPSSSSEPMEDESTEIEAEADADEDGVLELVNIESSIEVIELSSDSGTEEDPSECSSTPSSAGGTESFSNRLLKVTDYSSLSNRLLCAELIFFLILSLTRVKPYPLNLRESKIDVDVVHKMSFSADPRDRSGRTYLHRSDRKRKPSHQPEPNSAAPQPSEFHAQSSSSVVMPTNQMIMDELVSLRGYITNQMDAFDTQNQQIQYELHCLSSKLRSMEVDEDSSEPENLTPNERGSIQDRGSILKTSQDISEKKYTVKKILVCHHQKGEIVKKISASDLGTVLMKTPTSPKIRKGRLLMKTKKIKASRK